MPVDFLDQDIERLAGLDLWRHIDGGTLLITGASGGLGRYLVQAALRARDAHGWDIAPYALCRRSDGMPDGIEVLLQDVRSPLPDGLCFDYILHTAGPVGPNVFAATPDDVLSVNVIGTLNLLEHAARYGCKGFVLASTHEVYGAVSGKSVVDERDMGVVEPLTGRACYAQGKRAAETALACYFERYGIRAMSARLSRFFGPAMNMESGLFICDFLHNALEHRPVVVKGPANLLRPLTYIADTAAAMLHILAYGQGAEAYNVQGNEELTLGEIARSVALCTGVEVDFYRPDTLEEMPEGQSMATGKLRALGYGWDTPFHEGLLRTFEYLKHIKGGSTSLRPRL